MEFVPFLSTVEATFRIRRPVPLNTSLQIECAVKQQRGIRCWVEGRLLSAEGELLASCEAQLVDMRHFI
jgi:acyl-CoA thioesterase